MQQADADLMRTLHDIEGRATRAMRDLTTGNARTGHSALYKIAHEAADAQRHHRERQMVPGAALAEAVARVYSAR